MKRIGVIVLAIVAGGGFLAAKSIVYAADKAEPIETAKTQALPDDDAAWDAWRDGFDVLLDADEDYKAAAAAVDAFGADYEAQYEKLEAVRDNRYREIARGLYEEYFGEWDGTDSDFDDLVASRAVELNPIIRVCCETAIEVCGAGKVKSMAAGVDGSCAIVCAK